MQISLSAWDSQVPTLVLFEGGKEQRRLPQSAAVGKNRARMLRVRCPPGPVLHTLYLSCMLSESNECGLFCPNISMD